MKNIFKLMGIAVLACSMMMVSCGKDPAEPNDTTPDTPVTPTAGVTVTWDGTVQTLNWTSAYQSKTNDKVFWFEGAKGMNDDEPVLPWFLVPFYYGEAFYPACVYTFQTQTGEEVDGNDAFPLEVYNEEAVNIEYEGETYTFGDYQFLQFLGNELPAVTFDATSLTLTTSFAVRMFHLPTYRSSQQVVSKDLELAFVNYKFQAAN